MKPSKCHFGLPEVRLLGHIISADGKSPDPEKTEAISTLPPPTTIREVRSFLGSASYYRMCIPDYAKIAEPLTELTRKHVRMEWNPDRQAAFDRLKQELVSNRVMAPPRTDRPYKLFTDACDYVVGAILVQEDDRGVERVIQYVSHALSSPQKRWATIEKEAYAVAYAIEKLRTYLYGAQFTVYTDHKPLKALFTRQMNSTKVQRWGVLLAEYGARIEYRRGRNNIRADMLSRIRPTHEVAVFDTGEWVDPRDITEPEIRELLPLFHDGLDLTIVSQRQQEEFRDLWARGEDPENEDYDLIRGTLYSNQTPQVYGPGYPRLVLPLQFREAVIDWAHREVGHMATWKTLRRLTEAYIWPGMRAQVKARLARCGVCLAHNPKHGHGPVGESPLATYPMQVISLDLIGVLATSTRGSRYALTIIDHCTGWLEVFPLKDKTNKCVWDVFAEQFIPRHGVPEVCITDNGGEFIVAPFQDYLHGLGIEHHRITAGHPASNGRLERANKTIKQLITKACNNYASQWEEKLGDALLAYRTSVSTTTGYTPFFLLYGQRSRMPLTELLRADRDDQLGGGSSRGSCSGTSNRQGGH